MTGGRYESIGADVNVYEDADRVRSRSESKTCSAG